MARGQKVPDGVVKQIVSRIEAGATRKEVMKEFKLGYEKVADIAKDYGLTNKIDEDFADWFEAEWANIYPGNKVRAEKKNNKKPLNSYPSSSGYSAEFENENDRAFYEKFPDRWKNICGKLKRFTKHDQEEII